MPHDRDQGLACPAVLVADDDADDVYLIKHRLKKTGAMNPVIVFPDGQDLIRYLETDVASPCILFLDLKMPRIDGFDVLNWIRRHPRWQKLPVAVISSSDQPDHKDRAQREGVISYLEKYPSVEQLYDLVLRASQSPFSLGQRTKTTEHGAT